MKRQTKRPKFWNKIWVKFNAWFDEQEEKYKYPSWADQRRKIEELVDEANRA